MLSTLGKIFSRQYIEIFFLFFPEKFLIFHANCLQWRQFAWNVKSCFLFSGNKKNIMNLSSAELAERVVKVKALI